MSITSLVSAQVTWSPAQVTPLLALLKVSKGATVVNELAVLHGYVLWQVSA